MTTLTDLLAITSQGWMDEAACARSPKPDAWFPGEGLTRENYAAIKMCKTKCPVATACLQWALDNDPVDVHQVYGILGGLTAAERVRLRKKAA